MSYRHCINSSCKGNGLDKPEVEYDLILGSTCSHCGAKHPQAQTSEEWIVEIFNKVKELETGLNTVKQLLRERQ